MRRFSTRHNILAVVIAAKESRRDNRVEAVLAGRADDVGWFGAPCTAHVVLGDRRAQHGMCRVNGPCQAADKVRVEVARAISIRLRVCVREAVAARHVAIVPARVHVASRAVDSRITDHAAHE